jgi:hypothetical protein
VKNLDSSITNKIEVAPASGRLIRTTVCTENLIRVDDVMESPKLAE